MKIFDIINAWAKAFNPSDEELKIAEERGKICDGCEYKQELDSSLLSKLTTNDKILNKFKCGACGCPLSKKVFAHFKESCPKNKWEK